jgi:hypothetical protein
MGSIAFDPAEVIVGVDPHKYQHVGSRSTGSVAGWGNGLSPRQRPATPSC